MTPAEDRGIARFASEVQRYYGDRLFGLFLFGSRARGDHDAESDADIAVVLKDGGWSFWEEKMRLVDFGFEPMLDDGIYIQPWPVPLSEWEEPERHRNPRLIRAMRRDAKSLQGVA
jgi:hypothetical protein